MTTLTATAGRAGRHCLCSRDDDAVPLCGSVRRSCAASLGQHRLCHCNYAATSYGSPRRDCAGSLRLRSACRGKSLCDLLELSGASGAEIAVYHFAHAGSTAQSFRRTERMLLPLERFWPWPPPLQSGSSVGSFGGGLVR